MITAEHIATVVYAATHALRNIYTLQPFITWNGVSIGIPRHEYPDAPGEDFTR